MSAYVVTFAPTVLISVNEVPSGDRSIRKPVSLEALSLHVRLIWLLETTAVFKSVGAAGGCSGGASVVALAWLL